MPQDPKIATCCYCGARTVLCLVDASNGRRNLTCDNCGAPLTRMKPLKRAEKPSAGAATAVPPRQSEERRGAPVARRRSAPEERPVRRPPPPPKRKRRSKRRGFSFVRFLKDAVDEIEDLLD